MSEFVHDYLIHSLVVLCIPLVVLLRRWALESSTIVVALICASLIRQVRGEWEVHAVEPGTTRPHHAKLSQLLYLVWGTFECPDSGRVYRVTGYMRHSVLLGRYFLVAGPPGAIDEGTFSLTLNDDGDKLRGRMVCATNGHLEGTLAVSEWRRVAGVSEPGGAHAE